MEKDNFISNSKTIKISINLVLIILIFVFLFHGCKQMDSEKLLVIAHRGASHYAPENTLIAIIKAIEMGADYSELDVHLTKDSEIVLMHDETLDRTTNTTGEIWDFTLKAIKQLDAGLWFGEEFKGEPIPTLREVIRSVKGKLKLNIEIKISRKEPEIAQKVVDIIRLESFEKDCMVTSFDRKTVEKVKQIAPDIFTGYIFRSEYPPHLYEGSWDAFCCHYKLVNEEFVRLAGLNKKKIYVWTVNQEKEMRRLIGLGVDGIITNRPDVLKKVLDEKNSR